MSARRIVVVGLAASVAAALMSTAPAVAHTGSTSRVESVASISRGTIARGVASHRLTPAVARPTSAAPTSVVPSGGYGTFVGIGPFRALDTRPGQTTDDGLYQGHGAIGAGGTLAVGIAGRFGIPSDASAVVVNLTEASATSTSFLTLYPAGAARPNTSTVN